MPFQNYMSNLPDSYDTHEYYLVGCPHAKIWEILKELYYRVRKKIASMVNSKPSADWHWSAHNDIIDQAKVVIKWGLNGQFS